MGSNNGCAAAADCIGGSDSICPGCRYRTCDEITEKSYSVEDSKYDGVTCAAFCK